MLRIQVDARFASAGAAVAAADAGAADARARGRAGALEREIEEAPRGSEITLAKTNALEENLRRCARKPFLNPGLGPEWETWEGRD
jgi:hypothetical protein